MVGVFSSWQKKRKAASDKIPFTRKWPFAIMLGTALGIIALIDKGTLAADNGLASRCQVTVVGVDLLPVRSRPDPTIAKAQYNLKRGDQRGATTSVENGYRKLSDGNWAFDKYLRPLPPPLDKCSDDKAGN
jgi:hypothetical protein